MDNKKKLHYIQTIVDKNNLTKASKELFVSQPYLSKFIKNINDELGIEILNKSNNDIQLTFAGERYIHYLKELEKIEKKMYYEFDLLKENKKGEIRLGINPAIATSMLYKVIPAFKKDYPDIDIKLFENTQDKSEDMIIKNKLDIVIGMKPIVYKNLSYNIIYSEKMYLFVPKINSIYNPKIKEITKFTKNISLLDSHPIILTPPTYGIGKTISNFFKKNNLEFNNILTTTTVPTAVNLAKSGMGLTFVPETLIKDYINEEANIFSFNISDIKAEYVVIFKKDDIKPIVNKFLDYILKLLKKDK